MKRVRHFFQPGKQEVQTEAVLGRNNDFPQSFQRLFLNVRILIFLKRQVSRQRQNGQKRGFIVRSVNFGAFRQAFYRKAQQTGKLFASFQIPSQPEHVVRDAGGQFECFSDRLYRKSALSRAFFTFFRLRADNPYIAQIRRRLCKSQTARQHAICPVFVD